jgi:Holliday junction resolvase RusA-like endonuclease
MLLALPRPLSVNNLFVNIPGRGRVTSAAYQRWKDVADSMLWQQKKAMKRFKGPVSVTLTVEDKGRVDTDNIGKCLLDFLVRHEFIEDDRREIVRKLTIQYGDIDGTHVLVESA